MSCIDPQHGCWQAGTIGQARHLGEPLTPYEIASLPKGTEIVVTWSGGNGPWPYRVGVASDGERTVDNPYRDSLTGWWNPPKPLHRVTRGWDEQSRAWYESSRQHETHTSVA